MIYDICIGFTASKGWDPVSGIFKYTCISYNMLDVFIKNIIQIPYFMVLSLGWGSLHYDILYNLLATNNNISSNSSSSSSSGFSYDSDDDNSNINHRYFDDDFNDNNDDFNVCTMLIAIFILYMFIL
jgi:hypothetical protein